MSLVFLPLLHLGEISYKTRHIGPYTLFCYDSDNLCIVYYSMRSLTVFFINAVDAMRIFCLGGFCGACGEINMDRKSVHFFYAVSLS